MKTKSQKSLDQGLLNRTAQRIENTAEGESQSQTETAPAKPELPPIDLVKRRRNRALPLERLLELLQKDAPRFWELAEVVGKWVWIQFSEQPAREITAELSQLGFHWNNRRQLWQHPCGQLTDSANYDPRRRYGSRFPADQLPA